MLLTRQKIDWKFETFLMNNEMRPFNYVWIRYFLFKNNVQKWPLFFEIYLLKTLQQLKFINKAVEIPKPYNSSVKIHSFE